MLLFHVLYWLPVAMLAVIVVAMVGKVREGRYGKEWLGYKAQAPKPLVALVWVIGPMALVLLWAFSAGELSLRGLGLLSGGLVVLGYFLYGAASKRRAEGADT